MKRTRLKHTSKQQAKRQRDHRPARQAFLVEFPTCWFCGAMATDVHEITNGPCRKAAYSERCTWAATCNECNCHVLTDKRKWPVARQLAVKWINDREYWDLDKVNEIRTGIGFIYWPDVVVWICRELDGGRKP